MSPLAWRSPSTKRATGTILLPCRVKNLSARATRCGGSSTYRPNRASSARPPRRPINQPMLSPATAAANAITAMITMLSRPAPA
jgi:hypothetical protein